MDVTPEHIIWPDGTQQWTLNGLWHRTNGPAIIQRGYQAWYMHGRRHRTDGPAMIFSDGNQSWWWHGKLHRTDGPAVINPEGVNEWWINGVNKTIDIESWMKQKRITWPWDAETQIEFVITWI
jgi:hypothetical protein